jgi:hypothetical protein
MGLQLLPDGEQFTKDFGSLEVDLGGILFTATVKLTYSQEVQEGWGGATADSPGERTLGELKPGEAEIEWGKLDEAQRFIDLLGDRYYRKIWNATYTYSEDGLRMIVHKLFACRLLNHSDDHSRGPDALHETSKMSFKLLTRNGKRPM